MLDRNEMLMLGRYLTAHAPDLPVPLPITVGMAIEEDFDTVLDQEAFAFGFGLALRMIAKDKTLPSELREELLQWVGECERDADIEARGES